MLERTFVKSGLLNDEELVESGFVHFSELLKREHHWVALAHIAGKVCESKGELGIVGPFLCENLLDIRRERRVDGKLSGCKRFLIHDVVENVPV